MASADLKDAFYSVPMHRGHQKCLKCQWLENICKFLGMSNFWGNAYFYENPKTPLFSDDSYLQGTTKEQCNQNLNVMTNLLAPLWFTIHTKKSVLEPVQFIEFIGFLIGSTAMSVKINRDKSKIILNKIEIFP